MNLIQKGKDLAEKAKKYLTKGTTTSGNDSKTGTQVAGAFITVLDEFKSELMTADNKLKLDVILGIELDGSSSIKKADGDNKRIDKLFKKTVMQETSRMIKGGLFGGFRVWSEYVFAKLKQAVSKNQAAIFKLLKKRDNIEEDRKKAVYNGVKAVSEAFKGPSGIIEKLFIKEGSSRLKGDGVQDKIRALQDALKLENSSNINDKIDEGSSPATYKFLNSERDSVPNEN